MGWENFWPIEKELPDIHEIHVVQGILHLIPMMRGMIHFNDSFHFTFRSGKMSGLMQDRDSFFNDRITHLDDIQFSRNTRTGILIEDEKDFSDVRKV